MNLNKYQFILLFTLFYVLAKCKLLGKDMFISELLFRRWPLMNPNVNENELK